MRKLDISSSIRKGQYHNSAPYKFNGACYGNVKCEQWALSPANTGIAFQSREYIYDLRNNRVWKVPLVRTVAYGVETIRHRGPKMWEPIPTYIEESKSLP